MSLFLTDIVSAIRNGCLMIRGIGKTETMTERPAEVLFIRHAESARNAAKKRETYFADDEARERLRGTPDHLIDITDEGVSQAKQTGITLRERFGAPDYVYHSGYRRTERTCNWILEAFPQSERARIQVRRNPFIRERDPGYAYDMTTEEAEAAFPWLHEHWETYGGFFARPPGGESLADVMERAYLFLNMLFRDRGGKKVWVVTHGGTIRSLRFVMERWSYEQALKWPPGQSPKNCGVTSYKYDPAEKRLALREYNATYWASEWCAGRVAEGARWLDKLRPDWYKLANPDTIQDNNILNQIYDREEATLLRSRRTVIELVDEGFYSSSTNQDGNEYDQLIICWKREILKRRNPT